MDAQFRNAMIVSNMDMIDDCIQFFFNHSLYEELQLDDDQIEGVRRILQDFKNSLNKRIPVAPAPVLVTVPMSTPSVLVSPATGAKKHSLTEYTMYMKERMPQLKATSSESTCALMKKIATEWKALSEEEQAKYGDLLKVYLDFEKEKLAAGESKKKINEAWKARAR